MTRMFKTLAAAVALVCWSLAAVPTADAGIIVTEGKVSHDDQKTPVTTSSYGSLRVTRPTLPDDGAVTPGCDSPKPPKHEDVDDKGDDLGDLDNDPDGYTCTDVGGGVEVCEPDEDEDDSTGTAPGTAAGGGWSGGDDSSDEVAGCQGAAGSGAAAPWVLMALLLLAVVRRRA